MERLTTSPRPSKITVPKRCHPAAKIVFAEMRRQGVTYDLLEWKAGVTKSTFKAWRTHNKPGLESIQAALGALGWEFLPVPRLDNVPEPVVALIRQAAELWADEDSVLASLMVEIAMSPRLKRARSRSCDALPIGLRRACGLRRSRPEAQAAA